MLKVVLVDVEWGAVHHSLIIQTVIKQTALLCCLLNSKECCNNNTVCYFYTCLNNDVRDNNTHNWDPQYILTKAGVSNDPGQNVHYNGLLALILRNDLVVSLS